MLAGSGNGWGGWGFVWYDAQPSLCPSPWVSTPGKWVACCPTWPHRSLITAYSLSTIQSQQHQKTQGLTLPHEPSATTCLPWHQAGNHYWLHHRSFHPCSTTLGSHPKHFSDLFFDIFKFTTSASSCQLHTIICQPCSFCLSSHRHGSIHHEPALFAFLQSGQGGR